ncbi:MAG: DegT/DnrJ/EryC1/StrS family aminotransferase [Bacteroidales bacterium]|jgi:dTDP-4-amino-4,6-dideoxygalactose transaminase|nr:DegT/DnrJ/EryC1/StrS family aminotransferase [Bacteroidales bacterium]
MRKIQMVDLQKQYQQIKSEVEAALQQIMESAAFINGPAVKSFQGNLENFLGVKHVIPCANGTDALQVSLMALGLKSGDEVITSTFTFISTAEIIALLGLTPVLVDVYPDTFNIDVQAIEKAITPKTKAIIPVHLFGQCADMDKITALAKKHNLWVIEDNCQAIGADYISKDGSKQKAGTMGILGCTSFFPSKNLGCYGDGGAIFTNDDQLDYQLRGIVNHGMFVRYYHDLVGVNSRLDSIQAAILDIKLKRLDNYIQKRQEAAAYYNNAFSGNEHIKTPVTAPFTTHVFHQYTLVLDGVEREKLIGFMSEKQIPVMIYYPVPLHLQKAYSDERYQGGDFPVSEYLAANVISLPIHTELDTEQLEYITTNLLEGIRLFQK